MPFEFVLYLRGGDTVSTVQADGWASEPFWTGAGNLTPTEVRTPNCPGRSQSLYRLSDPGRSPVSQSTLSFFVAGSITTRNGWYERCTLNEAEIVLLHACGLSQRHTAKEIHRRHPNRLWSGHHSIGRIYSRFQEDRSVLDKSRAGRMTITVGCSCQDRGNEVSSGKSPQVIKLHSAHFAKPVRGSSKMHTAAATTAASGADSERCDALAQR
jgi:hypothetical protein